MIERVGEREIKIENPTWISEFRIHCRMVDRYRNGRVFVAGDAAHVHSPTGGQGIVTGIQDATNLAWKLARVIRGAPEKLLDTYQEERLPKAAEVLKETDRTTRLLLAPDLLTKLFRDLIVLPIMRSGWVQKKLFAKLAQLHVSYRGSNLSEHIDAASSTFLKAGDRAPDITFQHCRSGEMTTLFRLLEPMRPIALIGPAILSDSDHIERLGAVMADAQVSAYIVLHNDRKTPHCSNCLIDVYNDFDRLYGMSGDFFCLIRPDDHIGFFQRPIDEVRIRKYFFNLLGSLAEPRA
jgi:hypothetical protein